MGERIGVGNLVLLKFPFFFDMFVSTVEFSYLVLVNLVHLGAIKSPLT